MWVEPQFSLMFTPSGEAERMAASAPSWLNSCPAVAEAEPLAQSTTIFMPSSEVGMVLFRCST